VDEVVRRIASTEHVAAGGSAAAAAVALSVALTAKVARRSADTWTEAGGSLAQAAVLRDRVAALAAEAESALAAALAALDRRDAEAMPAMLGRAADAALDIARAGADAVALAADAAAHCNPAMRPDAVVAVVLAEAATRAAAHLIEVNLLTSQNDSRLSEASRLAGAAAESVRGALATAV
jgi:formiminotetrahydrofolate cyclodeaminase